MGWPGARLPSVVDFENEFEIDRASRGSLRQRSVKAADLALLP
jgi:hypothetical protein